MAWLRADSDTRSLRSSSLATSTGMLSNSSSSNRMPDSRESRLPGPSALRSNSRSTSLSGPAVPCAIDPNSRGLLAPYLVSTSRIAPRCSRRRSSARPLYVLVTPLCYGWPRTIRACYRRHLPDLTRFHPQSPMNNHLNHGSTTAQPYGCRICYENEKKAFATNTAGARIELANWTIEVSAGDHNAITEVLLIPGLAGPEASGP